MRILSLLPEISFFLLALVFLVLAMVPRVNPRTLQRLALILALGGLLAAWEALDSRGLFFSQVYRVDFFSQLFKLLLALGFLLVVGLCSELNGIRERRRPEFYLLLSLSTLGMMLLVSAVELITLYLALEVTSYSLYLLVPLRKGYGPQVEAGIKYFLVGVAASAVTPFGLGLLYGAAGTTRLPELLREAPALSASALWFIGLLFTWSGFFFKLALFPFHVWAPGVYQGSANQVTTFIATSTKVGGVAILLRMVSLSGGHPGLSALLALLAVASMTLGNLAALVQQDLKRLLAYSAVAQAGYILIGILTVDENGFAGAVFYALAYLLMNFLCFSVVVRVAADGRDLSIDQLRGLHRRSPLLALALLLGVFSLGGIPPTIGFTGKFLVFLAAMNRGHFFLVLAGMANVVVSLYYYALVVKAAYFLPAGEDQSPIVLSLPVRLLTLALLLALVGGGLFPAPFLAWARAAARLLF